MPDDARGACVVIGAAEGLVACVTRRPRNADQLQNLADEIVAAGGQARAYGVDARDEAEMAALFDRIEAEVGPIEVVVFNIGANVRFPILETTSRVFTKVWEMACFAGFLTGREAARVMLPRGRGTILFTGATASVRGREGFAAFAAAKHGLRAIAQSLARELGPKGIHVAHVVVDGAIDGVFSRGNLPDIEQRLAEDSILKPADIAATYVALHRQARSAWTHELDLRPWSESW